MNKISIVSALAAFVLAVAPGCRKDDIISIPDSNAAYDTDSNSSSSSSSSSDVDEVDPFNASDEVSTFTPECTVNVVFSQGSVTLDGDFVMNGGVLTCTATGSGGKGISCDGTGFFNGGTVNASAAGTDFTKGSVHPKAIKCDGDIEVTGGEITVSSNRHEAMTPVSFFYYLCENNTSAS